jgi:hypothetical protein
LPSLDEQDALGGGLAVPAQVVGLVACLDEGGDRVLERPGGLREEAHLSGAVAALEFVDQFLHGHRLSLHWLWLTMRCFRQVVATYGNGLGLITAFSRLGDRRRVATSCNHGAP